MDRRIKVRISKHIRKKHKCKKKKKIKKDKHKKEKHKKEKKRKKKSIELMLNDEAVRLFLTGESIQ